MPINNGKDCFCPVLVKYSRSSTSGEAITSFSSFSYLAIPRMNSSSKVTSCRSALRITTSFMLMYLLMYFDILNHSNRNLPAISQFYDTFVIVYASYVTGDGLICSSRLAAIRQEVLDCHHRVFCLPGNE